MLIGVEPGSRLGPALRRITGSILGSPDEALARALIVFAIAVLWLRPIASSFWLDELGTYWVVRDGLGETVRLALRYQGQSPLYCAIAWAARVIGGDSEIALRLPSLIAGTLGAVLVARSGRRLFGDDGGWTAGVAFAVTPIVAFSAVDARPYAFGYLALAAATLALLRLVDEPQPRWAVAYGAAAAATVHCHYLFGFALLGHLAFLLRRWEAIRGKRSLLWLSIGTAALLVAPLAIQIPYLVEHARLPGLSLGSPSVPGFVETLVPLPLAAGGALGWIFATAAGPVRVRSRSAAGAVTLAASLWLAPSLGLLLLSSVSGLNLLWPTYARSSAIGLGLLAGGALASLDPPRARRVVIMSLVALSLVVTGGRWHSDQDWRGAADAVNRLVDDPSTPVLMHAAFIEGASIPLLEDPNYRDALLAPISRYPMEGSVVPIPYDLSPGAERYLEDRVLPRLETSDRFVLVTLEPIAPLRAWLEGRLEPLGFRSRPIGEHGTVQVTLFERRAR